MKKMIVNFKEIKNKPCSGRRIYFQGEVQDQEQQQ